ncbi:phosphotransferase family protein [Streptomyces sp. NBC_00280]|uniref:phosphotransferase family protein n=1 Tax=Streptomyces sp. NBC_00280 TaxID=2975699 RepID=UPI00325102AC
MENEEPLSGGRITPGVVKAGDTVRRPTTPASPFVAQLLGHLQRQGFTGAPRHLGIDEAGRDVLSYVPGRVPARFQRWSDLQVAAAGTLLRALHDATRGSRLAGQHPVICHHDPGPNNAVFQKEVPVALIDWDTAAPGEPLEDRGNTCRGPGVCRRGPTHRRPRPRPCRSVSWRTPTGSAPRTVPDSSTPCSSGRNATPAGGAAR